MLENFIRNTDLSIRSFGRGLILAGLAPTLAAVVGLLYNAQVFPFHWAMVPVPNTALYVLVGIAAIMLVVGFLIVLACAVCGAGFES